MNGANHQFGQAEIADFYNSIFIQQNVSFLLFITLNFHFRLTIAETIQTQVLYLGELYSLNVDI